jgi:GAF domain-containing protein
MPQAMSGWDIDDAARLRTLAETGLLDSAADPAFDAIARRAADLVGVPVGLITLVGEDRQWFKAKVGTDVPGTPISIAICVHALARRDVLVLPDCSADPRTAENPLVTGEQHVRFYAGAPIVTDSGHALGTVCVLDRVAHPGGITEAQRAGLVALAQEAAGLIAQP